MLIRYFYLDGRIETLEKSEPLPPVDRLCETVDVKETVHGEDYVLEQVFRIHTFFLCGNVFTDERAYREETLA